MKMIDNFRSKVRAEQIKTVLYFSGFLVFGAVMIIGIVYAATADQENVKSLEINIYESEEVETLEEKEETPLETPLETKVFYPLKTDNLKDELIDIDDTFWHIKIEGSQTNIATIDVKQYDNSWITYNIQEDMEFNGQEINTIENQPLLDKPNTLNLWTV